VVPSGLHGGLDCRGIGPERHPKPERTVIGEHMVLPGPKAIHRLFRNLPGRGLGLGHAFGHVGVDETGIDGMGRR